MHPRRDQRGQAAVELVALLPLLAALWQAALVGHAAWAAAAAARAAARAHAVGLDPRTAARAHLPSRLEHGLRVRTRDDGEVTVAVRMPAAFGVVLRRPISATASFPAQR